jgi:lipid A 3-O-deacylase
MKIRSFFVFLLILFAGIESYASDGFSLGMGRARGSIDIYHVGFRKQFESHWLESRKGYLSGYHEISLNYWTHGSESVKQIAYSPVFTYVFAGLTDFMPLYLESGIGVSCISDKIISGRDLSTYFQFEDRIGVGLRIGRRHIFDLNIKYVHYSNVGIKQPNDGIDGFMVSYSCSL